MPKISKFLLGLFIAILIINIGTDFAYAASNSDILNGSFGLSSIDSDLQRLLKGITNLARPVVTIMTALAGMMVVLNIGGDQKQKIWNWILGIGLALNFGSVLWYMWGGYANISGGHTAAAEYSFKVFNESNLTDGTIDTLSQFMKYYLTIIVSGSLAIKPIAVKLLLGLALADMSIRLALDLTDKDKVSWLVKNFLKIGFYVFLITNWLGVDGLNLMDMLSKGFQQIGFIAGNYGEAVPTSVEAINNIDPKDNLAPDSIVTNFWKMFSKLYAGSVPQDASILQKIGISIKRTFSLVTSPVSNVLLGLSLIIGVIVAFLTAIEMFMARIEFYTLALLAIPMLAFGVVEHFKYLAQSAIRAVFNSGVKVCVISFLQAVICQMFTKYTSEIVKSLDAGPTGSATGTSFELLSMTLQLLLMSLIMYLIVSKIPKLIQGLLSGNPSMGGSDMTGAVMGTASTAAAAVGTVAGAKTAALAARAQAGSGAASNWRMSTMGQLGAAMLAKAPVTGSAYGAYSAVQNMGWNNTRQNQQSNQNPSFPSVPNNLQQQKPQQPNHQSDLNNNGNNPHPGGGDKLDQSPVNQGAVQQTPQQYNGETDNNQASQQFGNHAVAQQTPQQYIYKEEGQSSQLSGNHGSQGSQQQNQNTSASQSSSVDKQTGPKDISTSSVPSSIQYRSSSAQDRSATDIQKAPRGFKAKKVPDHSSPPPNH